MFGLRFGKVCEQKRKQKREKNATGSRFYPTHSVIIIGLALGNLLAFFLHLSCIFTLVFDTNMLVSKTQVKTREKIKNANETTHSVIRP